MTESLLLLPLRLGLRTARASLSAARELTELGLAGVEIVERVLDDRGDSRPEVAVPVDRESTPPQPPVPVPVPVPVERVSDGERQKPAPPGPRTAPTPRDEPELVDTSADPGAEDGAGASLRVAPPFAGYDELRAPDVIARLGGADLAELGETELYERTHRGRRTVLDAIARETKRRPPNWVKPRP